MNKPNIVVSARTQFVPQQSDTDTQRYVFAYTVTIENRSDTAYQLLSRHWVIQDANMKLEEVYGDGVIGEQPVIEAGQSYSYTSGAVLETEMGTMEGRYFFTYAPRTKDQPANQVDEIEIPIPKFLLTIPRTVH